MTFNKKWASWGLLTALLSIPSVQSAKDLCFVLYQMADNDLEQYIADDLQELSKSPMINSKKVTTWVYFDHRNYGSSEDVYTPMPWVFQKDGSRQTGQKPEGSVYIKQDHNLGKLAIQESLGEMDSDGPDTVRSFVKYALRDCKANGAEEYFMVFSSHGGGFLGFGGDDNKAATQRKLLQSNANITTALRSALDSELGDGAKFDVIGFDACLMQALGAADDYSKVGKSFLASEETEPGHGWYYKEAPKGSAMDVAKYFQSSFLTKWQGLFGHQAPKTLSILDLDRFKNSFLPKWEAMSKELARLLKENDPEVAILLGRARTTSYAFGSSADDEGTKDPSNIDMYNFMETFRNLCPAGLGTPLGAALKAAMKSYTDMFIENGNGPRTPKGLTGMHVFWPSKQEFAKYVQWYTNAIFKDPKTATRDAPEWLNLMKIFYETSTPPASANTTASVCRDASTTTPTQTHAKNQLLINPTVSYAFLLEDGDTTSIHTIDAEVAREVDLVLAEFGADLTPTIRNRRRRLSDGQRRLNEGAPPIGSRRLRNFVGKDFLFALGGNIKGKLGGSKYTATWDRKFFAIKDEKWMDVIYVDDKGDGLKEAPVVYWSRDKYITSDDVENYKSMKEAKDGGGVVGYLHFSVENEDVSVAALYIKNKDSFIEVPKSAGGRIAPVVYCDGYIGNDQYTELIGGIYHRVFDWEERNDINVISVDADKFMKKEHVEYLTIDIHANDEDTGATSIVYFEIDKTGAAGQHMQADFSGDRTNSAEGSAGSHIKVTACTISLGLLLSTSALFLI